MVDCEGGTWRKIYGCKGWMFVPHQPFERSLWKPQMNRGLMFFSVLHLPPRHLPVPLSLSITLQPQPKALYLLRLPQPYKCLFPPLLLPLEGQLRARTPPTQGPKHPLYFFCDDSNSRSLYHHRGSLLLGLGGGETNSNLAKSS